MQAALGYLQTHTRIFILSSCSVVLLYLFLTIGALFQKSHLLYNLEPYPDGLLYALSARSYVQSGQFALVYRDSVLPFWTQPLYAYLLIIGYFIYDGVVSFYILNMLLGAITLVVLGVTVSVLTKKWYWALLAQVLLLSHGYFLYSVTLPMAENAVLFLLSILIAVLLLPKQRSLTQTTLVFLVSICLAWTKYTLIPLAVGAIGIQLILYIRAQKSRKQLQLYALAFVFLLLLTMLTFREYLVVFLELLQTVLNDGAYFSYKFILPNSVAYWNKSISWQTGTAAFLWSTVSLTTLSVVLSSCAALYFSFKAANKIERAALFILVSLFLLQLPLLLLFYVSDTRYLIGSIYLFSLIIPLGLSRVHTRRYLLIGVGSLLFLLHLLQQSPLYTDILAANLLGRTTAWQQQSILHFNAFAATLPEDEPLLITALPPFLVGAYQEGEYRVLPLSQHQEFLAKGEYVWGADIEYNDLFETYATWLSEGKTLYISNAYITHQASVISDFERYKQEFNLVEVSTGCERACNISRLEAKEQ